MAQCLLEPGRNSDGGLFRRLEASLSGVCVKCVSEYRRIGLPCVAGDKT